MRPIFTEHYDLYQLDKDQVWQRIYSHIRSRDAAINQLGIERADPNQKHKWKAKRVEIKTQEYETGL